MEDTCREENLLARQKSVDGDLLEPFGSTRRKNKELQVRGGSDGFLPRASLGDHVPEQCGIQWWCIPGYSWVLVEALQKENTAGDPSAEATEDS